MYLQKLEKLIDETFTQKTLNHPAIQRIANISPMAVLEFSKLYPALNLRTENLLLVYTPQGEDEGFLMTDKHFYFILKKVVKQIPFANLKSFMKTPDFSELLLALPTESTNDVRALFDKIVAEQGSPRKTKGLDSLVERALAFEKKLDAKIAAKDKQKTVPSPTPKNTPKEVPPTPPSNTPKHIKADFLNLLKAEGDKYMALCQQLDDDAEFIRALQEMTANAGTLSQQYKAEHILLQDVIKLYNEMEKGFGRIFGLQEKFVLAYTFQRLQGGDMANALSLERINQMVEQEQFKKNVHTAKTATIFNVPKDYSNEYLLPVILAKLDHEALERVSGVLYHFAAVLAKTDGTINEKEKETLKDIRQRLYHPRKKLVGVKQSEVPENESLDDVMKSLNELIGLENIKDSIQTLTNFLKVQQMRRDKGLKVSDRSLHAVFMGPPGTGKTTIARLLARIYKHLGYLEKGQLVETDRAGLVAGFVGQTALKVEQVVKAALGGVLFIDEAYALNRGEKGNDFGKEAVEVLLKRMEDHRNDLVVIVAGYPDEMESFIKSNPGLESRFTNYFEFNHYQGHELLKIFELFANKADFKLTADAKEKLSFLFEQLYEKRHATFGNARVARNIFEMCMELQANRIVELSEVTEDILMTIEEADVPPVMETVRNITQFEDEK